MPNNPTSFSRRFQEYSSILRDMAQNQQLKTLYDNFNQSLSQLSRQITDLTDETNPAPLTGETLNELKLMYQNAIRSTEEYIQTTKKTSGGKGSSYVAEEIARLLNKDFEVIQRIPETSDVRLSNAFRHARSTHIDIGNATTKRVGGNLSSRMPIQYVDEQNRPRKGFFTPNSRINEYKDTLNLFRSRFPQYDDVWSLISLDRKQLSNFLKGARVYFADPKRNNPLKEHLNKDVYDKYATDEEFQSAFKECVNQLISQYCRDGTYTSKSLLNADAHTSVTDRNCAMTTIAKLTGLDHILARSERMVLYQNGQKIDGCFMDTAQGYDLSNLNIDDPGNLMWQWALDGARREKDKKPPLISAKGMKAIADLQVLDYLCGNVDRHAKNYLYQFTKDAQGNVVLDGVVGIDNDNSFGKDTMKSQGKSHNMGLDSLTAISRSTAERIMEITPEKLTYLLADYGLSPKELEAASKRLKLMQNKIEYSPVITKTEPPEKDFKVYPGDMYIVDDDMFSQLNAAQLSTAGATSRGFAHNTFSVVAHAVCPHAVKSYMDPENPVKYNPSAVTYAEGHLAQPAALTTEHIIHRFRDVNHFSQALYKDALWNTDEFKEMRTALKNMAQASKELSAEEVMQLCDTLQEKTEAYIRLKKNAPETHRGRERLSFARRLVDLCHDVKEDYRDGLLKAEGLPEVNRNTVISTGDHLFQEETVMEKIQRLKLTSYTDLKNSLAAENQEAALEYLSQVLYYTKAEDYARTHGNQAAAPLLEEDSLSRNVAQVKDLAQDILDNHNEELQEALLDPHPVERLSALAASHLKAEKKISGNELSSKEHQISSSKKERTSHL